MTSNCGLNQEKQNRLQSEMDSRELYRLAKAKDPLCIEPLMQMVTDAALEILRLRHVSEDAIATLEKYNRTVRRLRILFPAETEAERRFRMGKRL